MTFYMYDLCIMWLCGYVYVQSACRALETAIEQGHRSVEVKTDSSYTIKGELCILL